jgi:hypothetical protein
MQEGILEVGIGDADKGRMEKVGHSPEVGTRDNG